MQGLIRITIKDVFQQRGRVTQVTQWTLANNKDVNDSLCYIFLVALKLVQKMS